MLSVDFDPAADMVTIAGDPTALRDLSERLLRLASSAEVGSLDHDHLRSNAWAGHELSDLPNPRTGASAHVVYHVKIYGLPSNVR